MTDDPSQSPRPEIRLPPGPQDPLLQITRQLSVQSLCGRLDRSCKQASELRSGSLAFRHRIHHRCAVTGDNATPRRRHPKRRRSRSISRTKGSRPANPRLALACTIIRDYGADAPDCHRSWSGGQAGALSE